MTSLARLKAAGILLCGDEDSIFAAFSANAGMGADVLLPAFSG